MNGKTFTVASSARPKYKEGPPAGGSDDFCFSLCFDYSPSKGRGRQGGISPTAKTMPYSRSSSRLAVPICSTPLFSSHSQSPCWSAKTLGHAPTPCPHVSSPTVSQPVRSGRGHSTAGCVAM